MTTLVSALQQRESGRHQAAPSSSRLSTRTLNRPTPRPEVFQYNQHNSGMNNDNTMQQQQNTSNKLHSTPTPSSRGLNLNGSQAQQRYHHQEEDENEEEVDWAKLLADEVQQPIVSSSGTVIGQNAPAPPKGKIDPSLYSPPQFSPRKLYKKLSDHEKQQQQLLQQQSSTFISHARTPSSRASATAASVTGTGTGISVGIGDRVSSGGALVGAPTSLQRHQWDLNKFKDSPVITPRLLTRNPSNSSLNNTTASSNDNTGRPISPSIPSNIISNASYIHSPKVGLRSLQQSGIALPSPTQQQQASLSYNIIQNQSYLQDNSSSQGSNDSSSVHNIASRFKQQSLDQ